MRYSAEMQSAFRAVVSGRVQMVMYRDFAQRKASGLGITGEVRNLPDGTVEVIAEGGKAVLEKYVGLLKKGPMLARVDRVVVEWREPTGEFTSFSIVYP
jgi:acylphosphatase